MKVSNRRLITVNQALRLALFCLAFSLLTTSGIAVANEISRGFNSSVTLPPGTLVSLNKSEPDSVSPTNSGNEQYMVGVVTGQGDNLLELKNSTNNITVSSSGPSQVLVSDLGGEIHKGDPLSASPISGVAMRFSSSEPNQKVLGTATSDFNTSIADSKSFEVESLGNKTVRIGLLPSYITITDRGQWISQAAQSTSSLSKTVSRIVGHKVTNLQALTGSIIFMLSVAAGTTILFAGVRGSFASLGRNPLAAKAIYRSMFRVLAITTLIVLAGTALTYMVFSL